MSSSATMHAKPSATEKACRARLRSAVGVCKQPSPGLGHHLASPGACVPALTSLLGSLQCRALGPRMGWRTAGEMALSDLGSEEGVGGLWAAPGEFSGAG